MGKDQFSGQNSKFFRQSLLGRLDFRGGAEKQGVK